MIQQFNKAIADPLLQAGCSAVLGFACVALLGSFLEKFQWYHDFMMGKEDDA